MAAHGRVQRARPASLGTPGMDGTTSLACALGQPEHAGIFGRQPIRGFRLCQWRNHALGYVRLATARPIARTRGSCHKPGLFAGWTNAGLLEPGPDGAALGSPTKGRIRRGRSRVRHAGRLFLGGLAVSRLGPVRPHRPARRRAHGTFGDTLGSHGRGPPRTRQQAGGRLAA
jgi:hypothetical protein